VQASASWSPIAPTPPAAQAAAPPNNASTTGRQVTYTVRPGDTLYGIARLLQVTLHDLLGWNDMTAGSAIRQDKNS
jgi:LysM repeat protein